MNFDEGFEYLCSLVTEEVMGSIADDIEALHSSVDSHSFKESDLHNAVLKYGEMGAKPFMVFGLFAGHMGFKLDFPLAETYKELHFSANIDAMATLTGKILLNQ